MSIMNGLTIEVGFVEIFVLKLVLIVSYYLNNVFGQLRSDM